MRVSRKWQQQATDAQAYGHNLNNALLAHMRHYGYEATMDTLKAFMSNAEQYQRLYPGPQTVKEMADNG